MTIRASRFGVGPWLVSLALGFCACHDGAPRSVPTPVAPPASVAPTSATPPSEVARSARGMVVSDEARATAVGRDVLARGGNAADAAVALAFALAVTFPTAGNIGGGGFAVASVGGKAHALDFRETAPGRATRDMYKGKDGKPTEDAQLGIRSAGVPGAVAGLYELFVKLGSGTIPFRELVAPAVALARDGFVVDRAFLETLERGGDRLRTHPASSALYFPGGKPPELGSTFRNARLAETLERIGREGPRGFYEGETARAIAEQMKAEGGLVTLDDLSGYRAKWRTPIETRYRGRTVVTMPPPSSGGVTLAMMTHILEAYDLGKLGYGTAETTGLVAEAMRRAFAARNAKLGDPDFVKIDTATLLSDAWANEQRKTITLGRATPSSAIPSGPSEPSAPHTTHFSVVDARGDAVSLTTTINFWFGSGVTVEKAGFLLNDEMDDFAAVPGAPNGFGLVQGELNAIAPGKRMLSSMTPTIVRDADGRIELVLGAAGGPTIITAVLQELVDVVDHGRTIVDAVAAPRIHMQHLPDRVDHEPRSFDASTRERLLGMGYVLGERPRIADAPAIGRLGGVWVGVAEPRRLGGAAAGP
ncbi:MAG: gamma-glutamyltransferase [Myxococcales bacterium]|nr:gamma-glutamyltransferase [Myxococcales bacterium]